MFGHSKANEKKRSFQGFYSSRTFPITRIRSAGHIRNQRSGDYGLSQVRDGICGSALVRMSTGTNQDVLAHGEIGVFMVWSNIRDSSDDRGRLMCFCEVTDQLIAEGWEVSELHSTKRKPRESEDSEGEEKVNPVPKAAKTAV